MTLKKFAIKFLCGYFFLLALIGIFNRVVDPSWYYRDIEIKGFNAIKPEFRSFERDIKPALLMRDQVEAIILGSSYSEIGFNPTNVNFTDQGRLKSMNFAFAMASWEKVQCDFEFALDNAPIKRALVGFHPGSLPIANCAKDFASLGQLNTIDLLLNYSVLEYSVKTIQKQQAQAVTHTPEGMYFYNRWLKYIFLARDDLRNQLSVCAKTGKTNKFSDTLDSESELDLSGLQRMIESARAHGVELVLFAYPQHAYSLELEMQCGEHKKKWQAMKKIAALLDAESAKHVRAWHFYSYNDVTADSILRGANYWQDTKHFNFEVGNMMLADMFNETANKPVLGKPLTSNNIQTDYQELLLERAEYQLRHPEFSAALLEIINLEQVP
ncbi:MAG: hypothetical protein PHP70_04425 [Gallionella sp.]|nr:hypothetical protein [Gallionella sp.]